jgi:hypothetical protein
MRRTALLLLAAVLISAACDSESPGQGPAVKQEQDASGTDRNDSDRRTVEIYAAVIRRLVTKDHTFGRASSPFDHVYVLDGPLPGGDWPRNDAVRSDKQFSMAVRKALEVELSGLPPIDFISDPDTARLGKDLMGGVKKDGVILTVGPILGRGHNVKVANSLWCGGLCGQWLTYRLKFRGGDWRVTGTVGPMSIS